MYLTDSTGLLPISMTVVDTSTGQQLAMVSFDLPLKRRTTWWVVAVIAPGIDHKLEGMFMNAGAYFSRPLSGGDSLYVSTYYRSRRCGIIIY
jgi:hypothetical protein